MIPNNYIEVACASDSVYISVCGQGNMINAAGLRDFCDEMIRRDFKHFYFNLQKCTGLDSTFMGLIASLVAYRRDDDSTRDVSVVAVNVPPHCRQLLDSLGILNFIQLLETPFAVPALKTQILDAAEPDPAKRLEVIKACHERLMELNDKNKQTFGKFIQALGAELKKQKLN